MPLKYRDPHKHTNTYACIRTLLFRFLLRNFLLFRKLFPVVRDVGTVRSDEKSDGWRWEAKSRLGRGVPRKRRRKGKGLAGKCAETTAGRGLAGDPSSSA